MYIITVSMMKNINSTPKALVEKLEKQFSQTGSGLQADVHQTEPEKGKNCLNPAFPFLSHLLLVTPLSLLTQMCNFRDCIFM